MRLEKSPPLRDGPGHACRRPLTSLPLTPMPGAPLSPTGEPGLYAGIRSEQVLRSRGEGRAHLSSPTSMRGHSLKRMPIKQLPGRQGRAQRTTWGHTGAGAGGVGLHAVTSRGSRVEGKDGGQTSPQAALWSAHEHSTSRPAGHQPPTPSPQPPGGSALDRPGRPRSVCCDAP